MLSGGNQLILTNLSKKMFRWALNCDLCHGWNRIRAFCRGICQNCRLYGYVFAIKSWLVINQLQTIIGELFVDSNSLGNLHFCRNPWHCFFFAIFEVFTYQMMWVTVMTSIPILASSSILGTLTGMVGAIHYNVGKLATLRYGWCDPLQRR